MFKLLDEHIDIIYSTVFSYLKNDIEHMKVSLINMDIKMSTHV